MKVKEIPPAERPREKALRFGMKALSNRELLAILIRCGVKGVSSLAISDALLVQANGIAGLAALTPRELTAIKGLSTVKSLELLACFELARRMSLEEIQGVDLLEAPEQLIRWLQLEIGSLKQEHFLAVFLDVRNQIITYQVCFKGTLDASIVHPREIFKEAILHSAYRLLVVHNHPSGNPEPSGADWEVTRKLKEASALMGIPLLDHLIITPQGWYSFRSDGGLD